MQLAGAIVALVAPCLREEEQRELFGMVYDALMIGLRRYEERATLRFQRLGKQRGSDEPDAP